MPLRTLKLSDSVKDVAPLAAAKDLRRLEFGTTRIASLQPLMELPQLEYVSITGYDSNLKEIRRFQKARPKVSVNVEEPPEPMGGLIGTMSGLMGVGSPCEPDPFGELRFGGF